jgi:hypothetical protein
MARIISVEEYLFWAITFLLQVVLLWILRKYRHYKDFPAFTGFIAFSIWQDIVLFGMSFVSALEWYFYTYWAMQLILISYLFCVVHEVFESVTHRATWLSRKGRKALIRIATVASVITVANSLQLIGNSSFRILDAIVGMQRGLGMAIFVFMAVIVVFSRTYAVPWYRRDTGIAVGIVVAYGFQTLWPKVSSFILDAPQRQIYTQLLPIFDSVALIIWIYSFLQASRHGDAVEDESGMAPKLTAIIGGKTKLRHPSIHGERMGNKHFHA